MKNPPRPLPKIKKMLKTDEQTRKELVDQAKKNLKENDRKNTWSNRLFNGPAGMTGPGCGK